MVQIKLSKEKRTKSYLRGFKVFKFDNLLHLLFELIDENNSISNKIDDDVYEHILLLGYENTDKVPKSTRKELEEWYFDMFDKYSKVFDKEKQVYLLMAKIIDGSIIVTIDTKVINSRGTIKIQNDSIISFTSIDKINNIEFSTI